MASSGKKRLTYRDAGVDIDAGEHMVKRIKKLCRSTYGPAVLTSVGGFAGAFQIDGQLGLLGKRLRNPVLVACTDGVGTKLQVVLAAGRHDTIGIDLVAMSVNDLIVTGASPLFFLDYFVTDKLDVDVGEQVVKGIAAGCKKADCALLGGETAEHPGCMPPGDYDLAGFAVGLVEKHKMIDGAKVEAGDVILGLASTGLHSNGYSLARKVLLEMSGWKLKDKIPEFGRTLAEEMLAPTRIYVQPLKKVFSEYRVKKVVKALAHITVYQWITNGSDVAFNVEFLIDPLTSIMLLVVTGISLLVIIYSRDYMREHDKPERGYERFFSFLALFVFAMCALVLGGNFLLLYLGWEAVGLCSYLLIGFYYKKPSAAAAAKKAFLVNRVGDFGFGLAILLIYLSFGTLQYGEVFEMVQSGMLASGDPLTNFRITAIALLLLCGACGKSAQLPLHVWLPDAMEGPSPVSALIHAATMVTAGIFMIARCGAIFTASPTAMIVVAVIGAVTALFAATIALCQMDMKRILAYSTISQLGYMVLGVGVYAADSAMFHLFTHAFFKALLFLGAGSVMHAMGGIIDVRHFGGLRKILPWTFITFLAGALALAGFPMFSGFFSKDEIIHHAFSFHWILGTIGLVTAVLTAFYTFRMVFLAFFGPERVPEGAHPHESGGWMLFSLTVLAVGAIGVGYVGVGTQPFHHFLAPVFEHSFGAHNPLLHGHEAAAPPGFWAHYGLMILSGGLAIVAIIAAYLIYVKQPWVASLARASAPRSYQTLWKKYYVDELYQEGIVEPSRKTGHFCVGLDDYLIDGLIWFVTVIPRALAYLLRVLHGGTIQGYGLSMVAGIAIIVLLVFLA